MKCEREQQIIEAARNGSLSFSLRAHLQQCAQCAQAEQIAAGLREDVAQMERLRDLPPAGMVWRRAQARRRERALQRTARRPFLIVGLLGAVYSVVFLLWGVFQIPQSVYRLFAAPPGLTDEVAIGGAVLTALLAVVGSCLLVLETKR
jgi:predicted anti-sigma-YlaC factor YlaD